MIELPTPETDALFCRNGYPVEVDSSKAMQLCEKLEQERDWITEKFKLLEGCFKRAERERDEAREAFIEARKHREQLNSLLASYTACWDEIKTALGGPEEGDQTCDLDRVLKAIRERDEAREEAGHWKTEYEIVVDRLRGRKHPRDNEIIADDEIIPKLERERDEARTTIEDARRALKATDFEGILLASLRVKEERDEARQKCADLVQKLDAWEEIAEHLHRLVQHPAYGVDQAIQRMDVLEAYKHLKNEH